MRDETGGNVASISFFKTLNSDGSIVAQTAAEPYVLA